MLTLGRYYYRNGNYLVTFDEYSRKLEKKAFRFNEEFNPDFPDSIDLKITNKCSWACPWCHESSIKEGNTFNPDKLFKVLSCLPKKPIEIAIGGGNVLDIPKETGMLIDWLNERGNLPRITINYKDIVKRWNETEGDCLNLVKKPRLCIGISLDSVPDMPETPDWCLPNWHKTSIEDGNTYNFAYETIYNTNSVLHIIAGVFPANEFEHLLRTFQSNPILILGYKQWGRGKELKFPINQIKEFEEVITECLFTNNKKLKNLIKRPIGFDNLAIEQLHIREKISGNVWQSLYLGEEGSHSMYIDAVKGEFARTSRSSERVSWDNISLIDYFKTLS